jgi:hypothetical protein
VSQSYTLPNVVEVPDITPEQAEQIIQLYQQAKPKLYCRTCNRSVSDQVDPEAMRIVVADLIRRQKP